VASDFRCRDSPRISEKGEYLIIGGEDHKTGQETEPETHFNKLESWARERFPMERVAFRWSGQVMETLDGLAFIGKDPGGADNVYVSTGDSGMGMTHGTIAGMLLTDLIAGRENPWTQISITNNRCLNWHNATTTFSS
jgi:glycine/D-amino acid oxidase-like deaminating enzyme